MFYSRINFWLSPVQLALSVRLVEGTNPHFMRFKTIAKEDSWLSALLVLTLEAINNPALSVSWLASEMNLSERQFSRLVRKKTALTAQQILLSVKLHTAYCLLDFAAYKTVRQVAEALHFSDIKHFSRTFNKYYNTYPSVLLNS